MNHLEGLESASKEQLIQEVKKLRERLEIGYVYNHLGERIKYDLDMPDGIECRDVTIRNLNESMRKLYDRFQKAVDTISTIHIMAESAVDQHPDTHIPAIDLLNLTNEYNRSPLA